MFRSFCSVFIICLVVLSLPGACLCYNPATAYGDDSSAGKKLVNASELEERFETLFEGLSGSDRRATSAYTSIDSVLGPDEDIDWLSVLAYATSKLPDIQSTVDLLIPVAMRRAIASMDTQSHQSLWEWIGSEAVRTLGSDHGVLAWNVIDFWRFGKTDFAHVWECIKSDGKYDGIKLDEIACTKDGVGITWHQFFEGMSEGRILRNGDFLLVFNGRRNSVVINVGDLRALSNQLFEVDNEDLGQLRVIPPNSPGHIDLGSLDGNPATGGNRFFSDPTLKQEISGMKNSKCSPLTRGAMNYGIDLTKPYIKTCHVVGSDESVETFRIEADDILPTIHDSVERLTERCESISPDDFCVPGSFSSFFDGCNMAVMCVILLISIVSMALSIVNACHHH